MVGDRPYTLIYINIYILYIDLYRLKTINQVNQPGQLEVSSSQPPSSSSLRIPHQFKTHLSRGWLATIHIFLDIVNSSLYNTVIKIVSYYLSYAFFLLYDFLKSQKCVNICAII